MIASMTGYGKSENKNKNFSINVEIKSVNNRFFEPILKLPHSIKDYEQIITNLLKKECATAFHTFPTDIQQRTINTWQTSIQNNCRNISCIWIPMTSMGEQ